VAGFFSKLMGKAGSEATVSEPALPGQPVLPRPSFGLVWDPV